MKTKTTNCISKNIHSKQKKTCQITAIHSRKYHHITGLFYDLLSEMKLDKLQWGN